MVILSPLGASCSPHKHQVL